MRLRGRLTERPSLCGTYDTITPARSPWGTAGLVSRGAFCLPASVCNSRESKQRLLGRLLCLGPCPGHVLQRAGEEERNARSSSTLPPTLVTCL